MFATVYQHQPSLSFEGKAGSLPLEWSLYGTYPVSKHLTRVKLIESDKHSSLFQCGINIIRKKFNGKCSRIFQDKESLKTLFAKNRF